MTHKTEVPGHLPVSLLPSASPQHTSKHFSESCVDNSDMDSKLSVLTLKDSFLFSHSLDQGSVGRHES